MISRGFALRVRGEFVCFTRPELKVERAGSTVGSTTSPPYLGMREMIADLGPATERYTAIDPRVDCPLGLMLYEFEPVDSGRGRPLFFEAHLRSGVLRVPPLDQMLAENGIAGRARP